MNSMLVLSVREAQKVLTPQQLRQINTIQATNTTCTKYRNVKVYEYSNGLMLNFRDDEHFGKPIRIHDSQKECDRWLELNLLQRAGKISELERQKEIVIQDACEVNGKKLKKIAYKADFVYLESGQKVVEDVKPFDVATQKYKTTKDFNLKWKLLQSKYPDMTFRLF